VKSRRRDQGNEPRDQIEWVEQDGVGPVAPGTLEAVAKPAITVLFESLLRERRPGDVAIQPLEPLAIATVDRRAGVDVDACDVGLASRWGGAARERHARACA
jgi:hypothetical protein